MTIVTISRGTFTGGIAVAGKLASELGVPCISREVVIDAAQDSGVDENELQSTLEEPPHFWEKTPGRIPAHLNLVRIALLKRARSDNLVYHGYAGHLLLKEIPHVLRVRIIAGAETRIAEAMRDKNMTEKEATAFVKKLDNQLMKWTRFLYGVEWQDPSLYDIVLNLDRISVDSAVATIAPMTRLSDFEPTAESRQACDDLFLSSLVWAELSKDKRTRSANIRVGADQGEVIITGFAANARVLDAIDEVAERVEGVRDVDNQVGVGRDWQW